MTRTGASARRLLVTKRRGEDRALSSCMRLRPEHVRKASEARRLLGRQPRESSDHHRLGAGVERRLDDGGKER